MEMSGVSSSDDAMPKWICNARLRHSSIISKGILPKIDQVCAKKKNVKKKNVKKIYLYREFVPGYLDRTFVPGFF